MPLLNANSYEKGNWVLHMLRRELGDEAFWKGIRSYFAKYNGRNANTTDFRKVMELASGKNLEGFFKQWLYTPGHPNMIITRAGDVISIKQTQPKLYVFPLEISVDGKLYTVNVSQRETQLKTDSAGPGVIKVDPNVNLLASFTVSNN